MNGQTHTSNLNAGPTLRDQNKICMWERKTQASQHDGTLSFRNAN